MPGACMQPQAPWEGESPATCLNLASMLPGRHNSPAPPPNTATSSAAGRPSSSRPPPLPHTHPFAPPPPRLPRAGRPASVVGEMGQQRTLVYSFVARGTTVLADHAEVSGNFASVAAQCLQKLPSNNNRFNYNCDGHTFNYHIHDGFSNAPC